MKRKHSCPRCSSSNTYRHCDRSDCVWRQCNSCPATVNVVLVFSLKTNNYFVSEVI